MDGEIFIGLVILAFGLLAPIVLFILVLSTRSRLRDLTRRVDQLHQGLAAQPVRPAQPGPSAPPEPVPATQPTAVEQPSARTQVTPPPPAPRPQQTAAPSASLPPAAPAAAAKKRLNLEELFGERLAVWIGGVAVIIAAGFFVNYAIQEGLLRPSVQLIIGALLGFGLLALADRLRSTTSFLAQGVSGSGIGVLYVVLLAGIHGYEIISLTIGFFLLSGVTLLAVALSLRHGPVIAIMGLLGGFATPVIVSTGEGNTPVLFTYLMLLVIGLGLVARLRGWWLLAVLSLLFGHTYTLIWLLFSFNGGEAVWPLAFLAGGLIVLALQSQTQGGASGRDAPVYMLGKIPPHLLTMAGFASSLLLASIALYKGGYGLGYWSYFALIGIAMAALDFFDKRYVRLAYVGALFPLVNLLVYLEQPLPEGVADMTRYYLICSGLGLAFGGGGFALIWKSDRSSYWGTLSVLSALAYFLAAWLGSSDGFAAVWAMDALVLAAILVAAGLLISRNRALVSDGEHVEALYGLGAMTLGAAAISFGIDPAGWPAAFGVYAVGLALLPRFLSLPSLGRKGAGRLASDLGALLALIMLSVGLLREFDRFMDEIFSDGPAIRVWGLTVPLVAALLSLATAALLRWRPGSWAAPRRYAEILFVISGALTAVTVTWLEDVVSFDWEILNPATLFHSLAAAGVISAMLARFLGSPILARGGWVQAWLGVGMTVVFLGLFLNPIFDNMSVGDWPILNGVLFAYGGAFALLLVMSRVSQGLPMYPPPILLGLTLLWLLFLLVTLEVRQFFHGADLYSAPWLAAEQYTYSAVWLLLGVALLFAGILRRNAMLRYAALAFVAVSVLKVFLWDMRQLEGLWRVASFLGLGGALFGLAFLYRRFVLPAPVTESDSP